MWPRIEHGDNATPLHGRRVSELHRWTRLEGQVVQRDLARRPRKAQYHRLVPFDRVAASVEHLGCDHRDRAAGIDDRRESCRQPGRRHGNDRSQHGLWASSLTFAEVGVRVVPGVSQARRRLVRPVLVLASPRHRRRCSPRQCRGARPTMERRNARCPRCRQLPNGRPTA